MKKIYVLFTCLMLSTAVMTGCSDTKEANLAVKTETQANWGLDLSAVPAAANEQETAAAETEEAEEKLTEVADGILMMKTEETEVKAVSGVNVRSGPGKDYDKAGSLAEGDTAVMTGVLTNKWVQVELDGKEGYVHSNYLELSDGTSLDDLIDQVNELAENTEDAKTETTSESTEAESSKAETSKAEESKAESSKAEESKKETSKAETSKSESSKASSGSSGEDAEYAWTTGNVNVRKGPGASYEALGQLTTGEKVEVLDSSGDWWWKISYDGQEAYVTVQYLTTDEPD